MPYTLASAGGKAETVEADVVLVATGRKPYTSKLGLDAAGVETNKKVGPDR
jgi:dihydrolipoamide dehydrogenase